MQIKTIVAFILLATALLNPYPVFADDENRDDTLEIVSEYTYRIGSGDSREIYESLCLFGAKYKAIVLSARYLAHKGLLENYGRKQKELFCLAADDLNITVIEKRLNEKEKSYYVKIKAMAKTNDFIRAEIKNLELEQAENNFSWREEMEQHIDKTIDPGQELSRAHRYLGKKQWRIAIIYLDHLEKKYPYWQEIYSAKAMGFYALNKIQEMLTALKMACRFGDREACEDIQGFLQYDKPITAIKE